MTKWSGTTHPDSEQQTIAERINAYLLEYGPKKPSELAEGLGIHITQARNALYRMAETGFVMPCAELAPHGKGVWRERGMETPWLHIDMVDDFCRPSRKTTVPQGTWKVDHALYTQDVFSGLGKL